MKILHLCFSDALGGNELYVERIGKALEGRGHEIFYALKKGSTLATRVTPGRITLFKPRLDYVDPFVWIGVARLASREGIDILHVHRSHDLPCAAFVKSLHPRIKVVHTRHMQPGGKKTDFFHRWIYGKIDLLLAITRNMQTRLRGLLPMEESRIGYLPLGTVLPDLSLKPAYREQIRRQYNLDESDFVILFPNRLDPQKEQMLLIHALELLKKENLTPRVLFVGAETYGNEGYRVVLESEAKRCGVFPQCTFTGFIDGLGPYYAAADVVALATVEETFGMVLIEGMSWATPVIGSAAGGVLEIIEEGSNGFLFKPRDVDDLASAVRRHMTRQDRLAELGRNARLTVERTFDFQSHLQRLEELYRELCRADSGKR